MKSYAKNHVTKKKTDFIFEYIPQFHADVPEKKCDDNAQTIKQFNIQLQSARTYIHMRQAYY